MNKRYYNGFVVVVLLTLFCLLQSNSATAQIIVRPNNSNLQIENSLVQTPRETLQELKTAQRLMDDKRYLEATKILWKHLLKDEDSFVKDTYATPGQPAPENDNPQPGAQPNAQPNVQPAQQPVAQAESQYSLKTYIQNILARAPEEVREASELIVGAEAQTALDAAVNAGSLEQLLVVSQKYYHTKAGYKAAFLSGIILLNDGNATAAMTTFDNLAKAPNASRTFEPAFSVMWLNSIILSGNEPFRREQVVQLRQRLSRVDWSIEGKEITGFDSLEALEKNLLAFSVKRAANNCPYPSAEPYALPRWSVPMYSNPVSKALLKAFNDRTSQNPVYSNFYNANLCVFEPAVKGNTVFVRTLFGLSAVDIQTGKLLWNSSADFFSEIQRKWDKCAGDAERRNVGNFLFYAIGVRLKYDFTYGAVRADNNQVYVIEDIWKDNFSKGLSASNSSVGNGIIIVGGASQQEFTTNRLAAYDIKTGKLNWHSGSSTTGYGFSADKSLENTVFLGAPLIKDDRLYILGETTNATIVLYELDAKTGKALWSQTLGEAKQTYIERMYNLTPIYQDGRLLCPISNSSLVCVDLLGRRLLWGFNAPSLTKQFRGFAMQSSMSFQNDFNNLENEYNNSPFIKGYHLEAKGTRVFYTPVRSEQTYVIDFATGVPDKPIMDILKAHKSYIPISITQKEIVLLTPTDIRICNIDLSSNVTKAREEEEKIKQELLNNKKELENGNKAMANLAIKLRDATEEQKKELNQQLEEIRKATFNTYNNVIKLEKALKEMVSNAPQEQKIEDKIIPFPDSARLVGNIFESNGSVYIPLTNKSLAEFNISKREFVSSVKPRFDESFGAVFLSSDKVLSQKYDALECYDVKQLVENQRQIIASSDSVRALIMTGYELWDKGDIENAAAKFKLAFNKAPQICLPIIKSLAFDALRKDYNRYSSLIDVFSPAFADAQGQLDLAKFQIEECIAQNNIPEGLKILESLIDASLQSKSGQYFINIDADLTIDRSVWIGTMLAKIYNSASDEHKKLIDQMIEKHLDVEPDKRTTAWLLSQIDFFPLPTVLPKLLDELYQKYLDTNDLARAELVLRQIRSNSQSNPEDIAALWAKQAIALQKTAPADAAKAFKLINQLYPNAACCDGKTAQEYVQSLGESSPINKAYSFNPVWPQGEISLFIKEDTNRDLMSHYTNSKKLFANENVFFDGAVIRKNLGSQKVQTFDMYDDYGKLIKTFKTSDFELPYRSVTSDYNSDAPWFSAEHFFFVTEQSGEILAVNLLANPSIAWYKDYLKTDVNENATDEYSVIGQMNQSRRYGANRFTNVYGNVIFMQIDEKTFAGIDAATGRIRWKRTKLNSNNIVFVDNDSFYLTRGTQETNGNVFGQIESAGDRYSLLTGMKENEVRIPYSRSTILPQGVLSYSAVSSSAGQTCTIKLCSVAKQKVLWEDKSDFYSSPTYFKSGNLIYLQNASLGRVKVLDALTGKAIIDDTFEVLSQQERNEIATRARALEKQVKERRKQIEEEEKGDNKKRQERLVRESREGRPEDDLPDNIDRIESLAKNSFDSVYLLTDNSDNVYLVLNTSFGYTRRQRSACRKINLLRSVQLHTAKIYKYSRDGKALWKEPVIVKDSYLCTDAPSGMPFLIMACGRQNRENNVITQALDFSFIDKNSGQIYRYNAKNLGTSAVMMSCDPEKRTAEFLINNKQTLVLTFTGKPLPENAAKELPLLTPEEKLRKEKEEAAVQAAKEAAGEDDPFE